jgi:hypothetical protein
VITVGDARAIRVAAERFVRAVEPDAITVPEVVPMWEELDAAERQVNTAKTLLARRIDESRAWQRAGHRSAPEFMAARSATSIGAARKQLDVSKKVQSLPTTARALRNGELSSAQAGVIVAAAAGTRAPRRSC